MISVGALSSGDGKAIFANFLQEDTMVYRFYCWHMVWGSYDFDIIARNFAQALAVFMSECDIELVVIREVEVPGE